MRKLKRLNKALKTHKQIAKIAFDEELGDGMALRIIEDDEVIYEEDCKEIIEGDLKDLKNYNQLSYNYKKNYYSEESYVNKKVLEILVERIK